MSSGTSQTFKVRADSLVRFYESLARVLLECGLSGARLKEILSQSLRIECVQCGIQVSAEELQQLTVSDSPSGDVHPKLQRLRLGYCARQGCDSYYYEVHMENHPEIDWAIVVRKTGDLLIGSKGGAGQEHEHQKPLRLALYAGLGLLVLVAFAWLVHAHVLFAAKPHKYEIDPASMAPVSTH